MFSHVPSLASGVDGALSNVKFEDDMGNAVEVNGWTELDADRRRHYQTVCPDLAEDGMVVAVRTSDGHERIIRIKDGGAEDVRVDDVISCEELSPADLIQYKFEKGGWMIASIGMDSLELYRGMQFENWKKMITSVWKECLASFIRLLKSGPICTMFDSTIFPEAEEEKKAWVVVDSNGKERGVPHPVVEMRKFNHESNTYETIDCRLAGAPEQKDLDTYWTNLLQELRQTTGPQVGEGFIDDCLQMELEDLQKKYI